jgi:hypothetical protein
MANYDINGIIFYNLPLVHRAGPFVKSRLAAACLGAFDPPAALDEARALAWRERLKNARQLARSGVVHALAVQPGRGAARGEHPISAAMHSVRMLAPRASEATWAELADMAGREASLAAQVAAGAVPDAFVPALALARDAITVEVDGAPLPPDAPPDPLFVTPWLVFAERVDADPWLWVLLRGQTQDGVLDLMRQRAQARADGNRPPVAALSEALPLERFWVMGEAPALSAPADRAASPVMARLARPSPGLRVGRRALSSVLRRAHRGM